MATTDSHRQRRLDARSRGVSLIEAMVALAVMAFGMLSLVGVQTTMRLNNDLAKQRSEATWIATEEIEKLRNFKSLLSDPNNPNTAWADLTDRTTDPYVPPDNIGNTSYRVVRRVNTPVPANLQKIVQVDVSWSDRTGVVQHVVLDTVIAGADPVLSALLAMPAVPSAFNQVNGRDITIPPAAVDQGNGESRFVPPGSSNVAWYFNNATGALLVCDAARAGCSPARMTSGQVRFHLPATAAAVTWTDAISPQGPALNLNAGPYSLRLYPPSTTPGGPSFLSVTAHLCYADTFSTAALPLTTGINYFCAVSNYATGGWGGELDVLFASGSPTVGSTASNIKVCRYTLGATDFTNNLDHPKTYCVTTSDTLASTNVCAGRRVITNLIHQNFLVIKGDQSCPSSGGTDPARAKTLQHQP